MSLDDNAVGLTGNQLKALGGLVADFTSLAVSSLDLNSITFLTNDQITYFDDNAAGFTASELRVFSGQQIASLSTVAMDYLVAGAISGIETVDIAFLSTTQLNVLDATQNAGWTTEQLAAMTAEQYAVLHF
jgi:hypothetical protein